MDEFDIPIFKKSYELYKVFHSYRNDVKRLDRYTVWQRTEDFILDVLEGILLASQLRKSEKLPVLEKTSLKLNFLRIFMRLNKDVGTIDNKKYILLQEYIDDIGNQLGGWIKSTRDS